MKNPSIVLTAGAFLLALCGIAQADATGGEEIHADGFESRLPPGLVQGPILDWTDLYGQSFPQPFQSVQSLAVARGSVLSIRLQTPAGNFGGSNLGALIYTSFQTLGLAASISRVAGDFDPARVGPNCVQSVSSQVDLTFAPAASGPQWACLLNSNTEYFLNIHVGTAAEPDGTGAFCMIESCTLHGGAQSS